jgi:fumarylpyruvate hydrolase
MLPSPSRHVSPFSSPAVVTLPVVGRAERFPVRRIYAMVRNYSQHAKEMGKTGFEAPFFFMKPSDAEALVVAESGETASIRYPPLTERYQHEIEMVVAIGAAGRDIPIVDAAKHVYGYAVGLDMTRMDRLLDMSSRGGPWCIGKSFDHAAVVGVLTPAEQAQGIENAEIYLQVNGADRQRSTLSELIWNSATIIHELSLGAELRPGDLIFTGTPGGVAPVSPGDEMVGGVAGLTPLRVRVAAS